LAEPDFDSLDPYSVLGVPEQATNHQISKAYFKLSKQYHPDRLPSLPNQQDAHTTFTLISNAYKIFMDPDKRREHDLTLHAFRTVINNATNNVDDEDSLNGDDPEDKLHLSSASNSKTSMADSSGHPNDAGKKAAAKAAASSSFFSSSSDDSSDDSSNNREDGARSAPTRPRGKILSFQRRFGHGKQVRLGAPSADESSEDSSDSSNDHNEGEHSATATGRGKILAGKKLRRVLPTAKNRSTKSVARDVGQCAYFDVFSTYACHKVPNAEEFHEIKAAVKSVSTNMTSQRSGSTNCMSQLNSEVSSWNTKRQIFPSSSTIFNESISEDGLSSQSTYDVSFDNPHHIESIAPNPKVLFNSLPSNEDMKKSFEILVKAVNDMRIQSSSNNTLSAIDRNGRTFNTNIAEMHATRVCLSIDDVEFHEWTFENKFSRLWYCQNLRHSEILKLSIKNAIKKSPPCPYGPLVRRQVDFCSMCQCQSST
jgi:curved DNA-binding protein CbpA